VRGRGYKSPSHSFTSHATLTAMTSGPASTAAIKGAWRKHRHSVYPLHTFLSRPTLETMQFTLFTGISTLAIVLGALAPTVSAVCGDGQIAIAAGQACNYLNPPSCSPVFGSILANDCGQLSGNTDEGVCGGGYDGNASVGCTDGEPTSATTPDGATWTCEHGSGDCTPIGFGVLSVWACCSRN